ncbi:S-layer family protein [Mesorhizobium sp. B1-1-5]|uniref:beta strand repeat-containing protein n=1 Tax=Mesorhizobium sp. B1-1-5 TaxID=2589979 RepID=UPI001127897F|nr:S-layer family protein [Mesorhizobium sp. B1-1-5]TPO09990.1 S-layer family protein [Mesorhizobium sp. B1-1-5]
MLRSSALTTVALALSGLAAHAQDASLWQPQIRAIIGADSNSGYSALEGFLPVKQNLESVLFLDVRSKYDFDDGFGQDVGLGIRRIVNPDLMIGGYAYLNIQNDNSHQFVATTLGLEAITSKYDAHVNVYLPISKDRGSNGIDSTLSLVGNQLLEEISAIDRRTYAAWGIEGEVGVQAPIDLPENQSLRFDIGAYHFADPDGDDHSITGAKAGIEYTIGDVIGTGTSLTFAGEVRNDNRDNTQFAGSIRLTVPFNVPGKSASADDSADLVSTVSPGLRKRLNERVRGDIGVRLENQDKVAGTTTRVAINAATNAAFGKFFFANGDNDSLGLGTIGDPTTLDNAVAGAGANGIVVALGGKGNITTAGVTLADGQIVIGGGGSVQAKLANGSVGTYNFGGSNGTIQGTNAANPVISLANNNTLSGITITGGGDGIFGNNVTGTKLTDVTVDGAGGNGADFTGTSTGVNASNFTSRNNGLDGLHIEGDGTYNFTGTTLLQNNGDDGLDVTGHGTYTFATVNALDNTDRGITVQGTSSGGSFTTTGGTISGNGGTAVFIDPITAHVVLDSITQDGGTSGVVLYNLSGSFTVNGATTISNTASAGIVIADSPATIRFGDIDITNVHDDAIRFNGVNAAVVAGNIVISGLGIGTGIDFSYSQTNFTAQSLKLTGTNAANTIGIDLAGTTGGTITFTNGGSISGVDTGVRLGISGSLANSANANFTFGGGSIAGQAASLDARGLNQTLGTYAFGTTTFSGGQLFDQQHLFFVGANGSGDGSSISNLASITDADNNHDGRAIFVLVNDAANTPINAAGGFTLDAGQTMASFGNGRTFSLGGVPVNVTGDNVQHDQVVSDANGAATLTNTGAGDAVTVASNTSLLDFNIAGVANGNGIHGTNVTGVTLAGMSVSGASLAGVRFDGTSGISASNIGSTGNTGAGLALANGNFTFTGTTTVANNGGTGLSIVGTGAYAFDTVNAQNNRIGVDVVSSPGTSTLSIAGGTVSGNTINGLRAANIGLDVTLSSLSHTGTDPGSTGLSLGAVTGSFNVTGTTTISNVASGIVVGGSSATVGFGGKVTVNNATTQAIGLIGNSGAVTFGDVAIDNPSQNGINVIGANGTIAFGNIDITNLQTGKTGLSMSGTSTFTAATLDISGGGTSTGIDLSGTTGGSVTIGSGVISAGTGVQMGTNGAAGVSANTAFSFGTAGGASITGTVASLDMRGLMAGGGSYALNDTALIGPQLFDTANIVFVGDGNTGAGNGSSVNDLISAAMADDLGAPSNTIFVLVNNGSVINTDADGFTLAAGQSLVSFANGATVDLGAPPANVTGTNVVSGATQADPFGNGGATLINSGGSAIDLANGNLVQNLSVSNAGSGSAIDGAGISSLTVNGVTVTSAVTAFDLTGASGAIGVTNLIVQSAQTGIKLNSSGATTSFTNTTISGIAGTALAISAYSGTATFNNFDITGAATGINIGGGTAGTLTFDNLSSIAGTAGDAFVVSASTPNVTYNGTINKTGSGRAVTISGLTSGSVTFAGKITANVTGSGNAIDLGGNAGGTINFTGGLDLTTDGSFAFSAVNGGTLNVTGTNTIATGGGVTEKGIQLGGASGLVIGSSGVTFDSVKVDGSGATDVSGIVISNTSGGNVSFGAVDISRASTDAIRLTNVASGTYTFNGTTTVATAGGAVPGFAVQNSGATVSVDNLVTTGVNGDDVNLTGNTGTISIGGTITNSSTGNGVVVSGGSAAITVSANVSSSAGAPGTAVKIDGTTGGSVAFTGSVTSTGTGNLFDIGSTTAPTGGAISFSGSTLSATGGGGAVIGGLGGTATFHAMTALSITNATGNGLSVSNVASGAIAGFGNVTASGAGGNGIEIGSNAGLVTFSGTTTVAMGSAANTAGIDFSGTNANVLLGTTTISNVGANQTGIDFSGSSTAAGFGVTSITGTGDLTSRGIDLSSTTGNKVITFLQGSSIADVGIGVDLSSGQTTATSADATFTFGDGDSTDGLESSISVATNGYTVNTVGLDPTLGDYDFDDVFFTGNANLGSAAGAVTLVSQSGGFISAGTTGNLSMGVSTISLAAADALTGTQNFAFVGPIDLGASAFTLDSGQTITGFGNGNVVSIGTIQPVNVHGSLGATGGNITGDETVVTGTGDFMHLLGDNAVRHTTFDFSGASGSAFLIDQSASGFSNASGITIEGVTISNVAAGQTAIKVVGLTGNLSVINNDIGVAGTLLDVNGGSGAIQVSRGILPNSATSGTLIGGGINIANRTGGAVTFTDQVTIAGGNGVSISGGTAGGAVNFNGGLDIATSAGLDFSGLNVLTVAAAGSTTINATGQTALSLQGAIGAGGVHFDSITSTNAAGQGVLISGASGGSVDLDAVNVTASGGAGIEVLNSNGTYTFGNTTIDNSASAGRGVNIENAASTTTVTFDGALGITTSTGTGLRVSSSAAPAATIVNVTGAGTRSVSTSNGTAVDIASATLNGGFTSVSASFSGTANGINLQQVTGSLDLGTGTLTNTGSGAAFNIGSVTDQSGGNATVSYAGAIASNGSGAAVSIQELTGGSVTLSGNLTDGFAAGGGHIAIFGINNGTAAIVTFSGASKQIRSGTNTAVSLAGLSNGTVNFTNGGLAITTTSGNGFRAFTGGTVNVAGSGNTITTTSAGRGIDLSNVTVGSLGLNFSTVSANGPVAGISLASVGSSGGGAIAIGTANLQNVTTRGVDVTGTLGAALSFNDLDISLSNNNAVGFSLNGATINAAITANDFDVTNATGAGTSIGVDLRGATGGQTVRLGDVSAAGNSSSITGVNTGVFLNSTTNLNFTYGDGESATDQSSTISANVGIDSSSAPVAGNYNFQDVNFQASPGLGFGIGRIYFVGASATGDGSGKDQSNLATLSTAEAAAVTNDVIVLVNDGGTITAASTNADNTLNLAAGEQLRGFANGNIDLALTVPSTIQLASNNISIIDQTPNGAATLTTSAGNNTITLGASGNIIDGFILDGGGRGIKDNGAGASGTTISHMTIRNFTIAGIEITPSTSTTIDNVAFSGNATDVVLNALNSTITNVTSTGATGIAFDLRNTTGTTTLTNLNITTAATGTGIAFGGASGPGGTINGTNVDISGGSGITVTGGSAAIVFDNASSIAAGGSGTAASITNRAGGSFTFAGAVTANGGASGIVISGATAASNVSFNGTVDLGTGTPMTGTAVSINNNGQSSTINFANIDIASSGTTGFSAANGGTVNVATGTVSSTGAQAINLNGVATTTGINFTSTTSTGGSNNVSLTNVTGAGAVNLGAGTLSGASGTAFLVSGGSNTISYSGTIAKTSAGNVVSISSHTGGTATFGGTISATVSSGGIALSNNTGATINFTNTLTINTSSSNATGFTATGGGTISATGLGSTINSGQATALNVANTTIGSGNLIFQSISSNGGSANGIILDTTGSSGGLHVTGTGSAGSGGTIANKTGADGSTTQGTGIYLNNTSGAQFAWMQMNDFQNYGILGNNVTGFSLDHVVINGSNGTNVSGVGEGDVYFTGLKGSATVSNSTFTGAALDAFHVFNNNGETLNRITITGSTFATDAAAGNQSGDALVFQATNGVFNATVQSSTFTSARGDLFQLDLHGNVQSDLVFGGATAGLGNTLSNNNQNIVSGGGGVTISSGGTGDAANLTFNIAHNTMRDALGAALGISTGSGAGSFNGTIDSNTIGVAGVANSGSAQGSGIGFVTDGGANSSVTITNNAVFQYGGASAGIMVQTGDHVDGGNAQLTAVIQGNTVSNPATAFGQNGILVVAGTISGDAQTLALTLGGPGALANNVAGSNGGGGATDIRVRQRFDTTIGLHAGAGNNYSGGPTDTAAVISFIQSFNTGTVSVGTGTSGGYFSAP